MGYPIGMLEWEPAAPATRHAKRVAYISDDGAEDTTNQSNYNFIRWNAFDSIDLAGTVWQVCSFWNTALRLVIGVRNTTYGAWTLYVYDGVAETPAITRSANDNHNSCSIALDSDGYIHLSYDMHVNVLNYRRSTVAVSSFSGTLTSELSMVGTNEEEVSYPTFFRDPLENLYFIFRNGISGNGDLHLYRYTTSGQTWAAAGGTTAGLVIEGTTGSPTQSPYWSGRPAFTSDWDGAGTGFMWLSWVWRASPSTAETNHDISVVRWNGSTGWTQSDGTSQTIPITLANADIVNPIGQNVSLASFNSHFLDSANRLHIITPYDDAADSNRNKIWHTYFDGSAWQIEAITPSVAGVDYSIGGIDSVIDTDDTIRVICAHPTNIGDGIYAYVSDGSDWSTWTRETLAATDTIWYEGTNLTNVAGNHDRFQWVENGVYRMMAPIHGDWAPTSDDFTSWSGYLTATADAPAADVDDPILKISLTSAHTDFWAAVDSAGDDIRASDAGGQQFPVDIAEWDHSGQYALLHVRYFGVVTSAPTVRIYAGNGGASAPASSDAFGRYAVYPRALKGFWYAGGGNDRTRLANNLTMTGSPTTTANTGPMGQATYDYDGSTQYGLSTSHLITARPLSILGRFKSDSNTLGQTVISFANSASSLDYFNLAAQGNVASDPARFTARDSVATGDSDKIGYTVGTWHHIAGRTQSAISRTVYLDGVAGTPNTTSVIPAGINRTAIAVIGRSALDGKFDGRLADLQVWNIHIPVSYISYDSAMGNQTTFWNGWTWVSSGGNSRRRRLLICGG